MAVGNWTDATLCSEEDVRTRYLRTDHLLQQDETLTDWIAKAKEEIGEELDAHLRHHRTEILVSEAADLKDLISNPTVFKQAAIHYTLFLLFAKNVDNEGDFNYTQREFYLAEYRRLFQRAWTLVLFDKDADGEIEEDETATGMPSNRMFRV